MYHICFTNPDAWAVTKQTGVYGNVDTGNDSRRVFFGKLGDLVAIAPEDKVFFYIKQTQSLAGLFEVVGEPYFCQDNLFNNPTERYSMRFNFNEIKRFDKNIPASELAKLIEKRQLFSLTTFERDQNAGFRGIRQITDEEGEILEETFLRFNPKTDFTRVTAYTHPIVPNSLELREIVEQCLAGTIFNIPTEIIFTTIPVTEIRRNTFAARYENILQGYIYYCLRRNFNNVVEDLELSNFTESLMEVPMLKAQQFRSDILCLFREPQKKPHFYSIIETKRDRRISIADLSQLIGYMKTFASSNEIPFNSIEGVYISFGFEDETVTYLRNRRDVEKENPVRLIRYSVTNAGIVSFEQIDLD